MSSDKAFRKSRYNEGNVFIKWLIRDTAGRFEYKNTTEQKKVAAYSTFWFETNGFMIVNQNCFDKWDHKQKTTEYIQEITWIMSKVATQWTISSEGIFTSFWLANLSKLGSGALLVADETDEQAVDWSWDAKVTWFASAGAEALPTNMLESSTESWLFTKSIASSILSMLTPPFLKDETAWNQEEILVRKKHCIDNQRTEMANKMDWPCKLDQV